MRRPRKTTCTKSKRYPKGVKYSGSVEYRGLQRWVGTFATREAWIEKAREVEEELQTEQGDGASRVEVPTVAEFLGVKVEGGRVVPRDPRAEIWPWTHRRGITKDSSARTLLENIRPFVRRYGRRRIDSFSRREAREIAGEMTNGQKAAVRRLFSDALDDEVVERNYFERLSVKQVSRLERDGFRLVTETELEALIVAAETSREDAYALTIKAIVLAEATIGVRPSEIFGMERELLDREGGCILLRNQIDDVGAVVPLKNSRQRLVPVPADLLAAIDEAPNISERWLFTGVRGRPLTLSGWDRYWNAVRVAAGLPMLQFYELKHRAITWMSTPKPDGLGMDDKDVATIVGHEDGGETIRKHYRKLDQRLAIRRYHDARGER